MFFLLSMLPACLMFPSSYIVVFTLSFFMEIEYMPHYLFLLLKSLYKHITKCIGESIFLSSTLKSYPKCYQLLKSSAGKIPGEEGCCRRLVEWISSQGGRHQPLRRADGTRTVWAGATADESRSSTPKLANIYAPRNDIFYSLLGNVFIDLKEEGWRIETLIRET